jgi:hypothetical protein
MAMPMLRVIGLRRRHVLHSTHSGGTIATRATPTSTTQKATKPARPAPAPGRGRQLPASSCASESHTTS